MLPSRIQAVDKASVHRICSGQVVLDLATAVKELIENSLDAGATSIEIRFKDYGIDTIEVIDNGSGISDDNLDSLALKHYTSKLTTFDDLAKVTSFGFRGEALSSLCALATLTVTTATGESPAGVKVAYDSNGIPGPKIPAPRSKGTSVHLSNLFDGMPVRRTEFVKNAKREYAKCLKLIQAYALISIQVRISCTLVVDKGSKSIAIATSGNPLVRSNIVNVFGAKSLTNIIDFDLELMQDVGSESSDGDDEQDDDGDNDGGKRTNTKSIGKKNNCIRFVGHISSPEFGHGRSSGDRQYLYINGRPCTLPKILRVVSDVYHSFNTNQSPFLVGNLIMPTAAYDVNVSPDKRTIFLHNERAIVEELRNKLTEQFEPSRSTFSIHQATTSSSSPSSVSKSSNTTNTIKSGGLDLSTKKLSSNFSMVGNGKQVLQDDSVESEQEPGAVQDKEDRDVEMVVRATTSVRIYDSSSVLTDHAAKRTRIDDHFSRVESNEELEVDELDENANNDEHEMSEINISDKGQVRSVANVSRQEEYDPLATTVTNRLKGNVEAKLDDNGDKDGDEEGEDDDDDGYLLKTPKKIHRVVVLDSDVQNDGEREWVTVPMDMEYYGDKRRSILKLYQDRQKVRRQQQQSDQEEKAMAPDLDDNDEVSLADASVANLDDAQAQQSLNRVISKADFRRMKILGQFNRAFIIVQLDEADRSQGTDGSNTESSGGGSSRKRKQKAPSSDLFVIDQHASDEKYNFETLQSKTVFSTQRLFKPRPLHLTAQEELTVLEDMEIFNKNGFFLNYSSDSPTGSKLSLETLPVSERVVFDAKDFDELVYLVSEHPGQMARCSKVRNLFASRACRRSVMIGHVLNHGKMKTIVHHMGDIDQPWNCPHGRPTMRHLLDLSVLKNEQNSVFDPVAVKRPTKHRGSLFKQFLKT